ncbi:MAG: hypothetical protein Q7T82_04230 [Armatimonadota bacterium]|nr:hypothetical protein [Armatimonadota bacterium]
MKALYLHLCVPLYAILATLSLAAGVWAQQKSPAPPTAAEIAQRMLDGLANGDSLFFDLDPAFGQRELETGSAWEKGTGKRGRIPFPSMTTRNKGE